MKHIGTPCRPSGLEGQTLPSARGELKAVVLAGGLGTRLRPFTLFLPKPMLPVGNMPILEHIIEWLKSNGITRIVVSTGYLGRMIEEYFGAGTDFGVQIEYARSGRPLGTAGQLKAAEGKLPSRFVCLYGDALVSFDLRRLLDFHAKKAAMVTMALMTYETKINYGTIDVDGDGRVSRWLEKPVIKSDINVGCYVMEKTFLKYIPASSVYGMNYAFDQALKKNEPVYALKVRGIFKDIGDRKSYKEADDYYIKNYGKVP